MAMKPEFPSITTVEKNTLKIGFRLILGLLLLTVVAGVSLATSAWPVGILLLGVVAYYTYEWYKITLAFVTDCIAVRVHAINLLKTEINDVEGKAMNLIEFIENMGILEELEEVKKEGRLN
jgi:hypothetical protein